MLTNAAFEPPVRATPQPVRGALPEQVAALAQQNEQLRTEVQALKESLAAFFQRMNTPGALQISDAIINATNGIVFPATQNTSTDANTLDDFANNKSWTPADTSGAALTLAAAEGRYTKVGDTVLAWGYVQYPATASGANAKIGGLPFTVANTNSARGGGNVSFTDEATLQWVIATNNTTEMQFITAAGAVITNATLSGDRIYFLVIYPQV